MVFCHFCRTCIRVPDKAVGSTSQATKTHYRWQFCHGKTRDSMVTLELLAGYCVMTLRSEVAIL